ncbi:hypothetical protein ATCVNEJV2_978L [Acanthocystis turfacea Chlorella virus NE-JV-2]|nr:hypothetical protein ATCVNEJV2_978L [Acanthocystis turfacea Chlorella virus NE-JV-2]
MKTLEYYWDDGSHTVFKGYTIGKNSDVTNTKINHVMTQHEDDNGYIVVTVRHEGTQHGIRVARAMASTFLGPPPTLHHTAEHDDRNRKNNNLKNIIWLCKPGQAENRDVPTDYNSAFIIVRHGVELTAKDWVKVYKKPNGEEYVAGSIAIFARQQKHEFKYKIFQNLHGEVWKAVAGSKNKKGEWFISNKNRMKYKTTNAENVLTVDQLHKDNGYPEVKINGKMWKCHYLSMMTFRPREYAAKLPGDIIMHKNDDKLNFNPFRLHWGTRQENGKDAHRNGKYDDTKSAQKSVTSYINGEFEKEHESLHDAERYLQENGYSGADRRIVSYAVNNGVTRYDRAWKLG